jgi:hypothetical protein
MQFKTPEEKEAIRKKREATRQKNLALQKQIEEEYEKKAIEMRYGIQHLEKKLSDLKTIDLFQTVSAKITNKTLLTSDEIIKFSRSWSEEVGVYFLIDNDEVVYVGQSVNIFSRISQHKIDKKFDRYAFIPCSKENLDKLESLYIHFLRPRLNGKHKDNIVAAPLTLEKLLEL